MCGPQLGLDIALRALLGEPTFVRTSVTSPFGSSFSSVAPISSMRAADSSSDVPAGEAHVDALHRLVDLGEERARQARRRDAARDDEGRGGDDDRPPIRQDEAERVRVALRERVDRDLDALHELVLGAVLEKVVARDGRDADRNEVRRGHRDGDRERERREELLREACEEQHRQEHRHRRERRGEHGERHGVRPVERRTEIGLSHALMAVDRLEHDDCVVHQPSHRERQPAERERVERLPRCIEDDERDRERQRDRDRHDGRAADALEKDEDDDRDEDEGLDHLAAEPVVARSDEGRLVEHRLDLHAGREILQVRDGLVHRVDDLERVSARDAKHVEVDGVHPADRDRLGLGGATVLDVRDVANVHGGAVVRA